MNRRFLESLLATAAAICAVAGVIAGAFYGIEASRGLFVGGLWNLVNLWCLTQLIGAWVGPDHSRRRIIVWILVKFPALYFLAWALLSHPAISFLWFGVGFTVVLASAIGFLAIRSPRILTTGSHGS